MSDQHSAEAGDAGARTPSAPMGTALAYWFKLGWISFGGPAGQISLMHQELVERRRWISNGRFLHALNYTMVLPGPEAQQLATYIGWLLHGVWGGIAAGALFVLPSLFLLIGLSWIYMAYGDVPVVEGLLYGIKPAVTAIVAFAAYRIGTRVLKNGVLWSFAVAAFIAIFVFNLPFPAIIIAAAILGFIGGRLRPDKFQAGGAHGPASDSTEGEALIDDHTATPEHARFRWGRVARYAAVGLGLWIGAMTVLVGLYGWHGALTQMGWFFTKAALVTFGGAYAVLPYVYQGGVEQYQWLTGPQMIDGLALGETTPGPLIMIVAFVGFVGGWTAEIAGVASPWVAGALAASVVTFFTFLPSFLFILLGAPAVESTRANLHFTAPLTGITAAVVGVILNLAVFFAYHVLWPAGLEGPFDWLSALLGVIALGLLFVFRIGFVVLIAICGAAGLGLHLLRIGAIGVI